MKSRIAWKIAGDRSRYSQPQQARAEVAIQRSCLRAARKEYGRPSPFDWAGALLRDRGDV